MMRGTNDVAVVVCLISLVMSPLPLLLLMMTMVMILIVMKTTMVSMVMIPRDFERMKRRKRR